MDKSTPDIQKMRQEAIRYVNNMRAKSKFNSNIKGMPHISTDAFKDDAPETGKFNNESENNDNVHKDKDDKPKLRKKDPVSDIFDVIMKDKDRTLILVLIFILTSEGADTSLVLALMYVLI